MYGQADARLPTGELAPSSANGGSAAGETHASSFTAEWGSAYRRFRARVRSLFGMQRAAVLVFGSQSGRVVLASRCPRRFSVTGHRRDGE